MLKYALMQISDASRWNHVHVLTWMERQNQQIVLAG